MASRKIAFIGEAMIELAVASIPGNGRVGIAGSARWKAEAPSKSCGSFPASDPPS